VAENWVDIAILFVVAAYALQGLHRGFVLGTLDLVGFVVSLLVALRFYPEGANLLEPYVPLPMALLKPAAFLAIWLLADVVLTLLTRALDRPLDLVGRLSSVNGVLGLVPGALKGAVVVALVLALALAVPLPEPVKADISGSGLGGRLANEVSVLERTLQDVFGDAVLDGINFATVRPQADERVALKFTVAEPRVDTDAEARMLKLLNEERVKAGLGTLQIDPALVESARAHSRDMLAQGYFSHVNNEGKTVVDREKVAGARFKIAGENLALAPTVDVAHGGLMDSPGHRANILSPHYTRVGIGVLDGGLHGKMFTQNFAD
jgi:uncharacterized protein YkwD/uncharacterized membrane protein required for colicin V production